MKKLFYISFLSLGLLFTSCGSDDTVSNTDNPKNEENPTQNPPPVTVTAEWEPTTIVLQTLIPLPIEDLEYPHTVNCTKDFLQLFSDDSAKYFRYEGTDCKVTEYQNAFKRTGNQVTLNVMEYQISGEIKNETATSMEIHSDVSQYEQIITIMFPEYAEYLPYLKGSTVKLSFKKK